MAKIVSRTAFLLAAIAAPSAALAQDSEQRITVIGAMQDPEQRITVIGAMQDPEQRITVIGAMQDPEQRIQVIGAIQDPEQRIQVIGAIQDPEQRIQVIGATSERGRAAPAEDPTDKAIPEIPVVYEDDEEAPAQPAPAPGR